MNVTLDSLEFWTQVPSVKRHNATTLEYKLHRRREGSREEAYC
jgi:hypothetical protein